jgi:hypothetical protein
MPNPFLRRFSKKNSSSATTKTEESTGRPKQFSFPRLSLRRGTSSNSNSNSSSYKNNKRPLADVADCSYDTKTEDDENSWFDFSTRKEHTMDSPSSISSSISQSTTLSSQYRKVVDKSPSTAETAKKNPHKRQKVPAVVVDQAARVESSPKREALTKPPPQFTTPKGEASSSAALPNSFAKPAATLDSFQSILDRPFEYWQQVNAILKDEFPTWTRYQRGRVIHHLIHFLELKIGKDEYVPTGLLLPTPIVELAWRALVMETSLYVNLTYALQDFHNKPRSIIHYTLVSNRNLPRKEAQDKIRRTQSLFLVYFKEIMPSTIEDEPREPMSSPPPFTRPKAVLSTPIFELSSLSIHNNYNYNHNGNNNARNSSKPSFCINMSPCKLPIASPMDDDTVVSAMTTSSETNSCLMGLGLLNEG